MGRSQLTPLARREVFDVDEPIVVLQALRIRQCAGWRDDLAGDDLLDRELDFLEVDGCLSHARRS